MRVCVCATIEAIPVCPCADRCGRAALCRQLLRNNWVATLNSALRHLAARDGVPLLDVEALHLQLPAAHCHKPDGFHPQAELLVHVAVNLLLNMYEQATGSSLLDEA